MSQQHRRGHGEGSIYQRESDGRWCASVDLGYVNGRRTRKMVYGRTRKEVAEKLKALHRDQASGAPIITERRTVAQYLNRWLDDVVSQRNKPRTQESYQAMVRLHIAPLIGHYQLSKLAPQHVQAMLNELPKKGLSARTVHYARAILRRALNQAVRWKLVAFNAAEPVEPPRVEKTELQPLTLAQVQALLEAVRGHRFETIYRVALSLGLRRGEVLGLQWSDVNFEARTLRITGTLQRVRGKLVRTSLKTVDSKRTLSVPETLLAALRAHRDVQQELWPDAAYIFVSTTGTPIEPMNLRNHFKAILKQIGLPATIRFHDLRHSCATLLIAQGVHPRVIQSILGHAQISTTMDIYGHVMEETQRDATDKLDALLWRRDAAREDS
jgi:integrase